MSSSSLPPIRACLFDVDGLLINSEDIYTDVTNTILRSLDRPDLPWHIKAQLQGRPAPAAGKIFREWAQLPISQEEYENRLRELQLQLFPSAAPLPGVNSLLATLKTASTANDPSEPIHLAIATSSHVNNYILKTAHLEETFKYIPKENVVTGDDPRIKTGRGKPAPDIYLLALETINEKLRAEGKKEVTPAECLVFEDAVPGVEAGRRAGMRVVWCPHVGLLGEYKGREEQVLAGVLGEADVSIGGEWGMVGEVGDGSGELRSTLEGFNYEKYGIVPKTLN